MVTFQMYFLAFTCVVVVVVVNKSYMFGICKCGFMFVFMQHSSSRDKSLFLLILCGRLGMYWVSVCDLLT